MKRSAHYLTLLGALALAGCSTTPPAPVKPRTSNRSSIPEPGVPALPPANSGRGAYYQDDGPGDNPPAGLLEVPDAEVRNDPPLPRSNRPYVVFGKTYTPIAPGQPFSQRGPGTWYGKKFHGQRTSSGEIYDMYKMTAAHPTLPIPSYARVTNLSNDKTVIVRINDRGPFHSTRVIDVSYTAALKLGLLASGSGQLEVVHLLPADIEQMIAERKANGGAPAIFEASGATARNVMPKAAPMLALGGAAEGSVTPAGGAAAPGGYYLQFGAYKLEASAKNMRGKLAEASGGDAFEVVQAGAVYRLFGGPYASRDDAAKAMERIPSSLRSKPIIVQR